MTSNLEWSDTEVRAFITEAARTALGDVSDAYENVAHEQFPVLDLMTTRPPGEGWSLPPGNLRESAKGEITETLGGDPVMQGLADPVIRFRKKRRHRIRVTTEGILRGIADHLRATGRFS